MIPDDPRESDKVGTGVLPTTSQTPGVNLETQQGKPDGWVKGNRGGKSEIGEKKREGGEGSEVGQKGDGAGVAVMTCEDPGPP